jgi:pimeloyl-ACP methyl ester carboxylesterase
MPRPRAPRPARPVRRGPSYSEPVRSDDDGDLLRLPDGRRAQIWRGGADAGPVVFFAHGCPDSRLAACSGAAAARRAGVGLLAMNRPGYGRSDPCASGHLSVADDIVAVADLLGIDRFAVLGMSLGGPYVMACAARHPDRVRSLGVVASPAMPSGPGSPGHRDHLSPTQQAFFAQVATSTVAGAVELFRPEFEEYVAQMPLLDDDDALAARITQGLHALDARLVAALPVRDVAGAAREALACSDGYLRDAAATFRNWAFQLDHIKCPTRLWYGHLDANAPPRNGQRLAQEIPGATLVIRPETAHLGTLIAHWDEILTTLR